MKKFKKILIVISGIIVVFGLAIFLMFQNMSRKTKEALNAQVNETIDMNLVSDGTYTGSSEGGMVKVEVEVEVKNHKITNITILKHNNMKGKPAEAMIDNMVQENTDDVDLVSGATASSKTIRNAVNKALQKGIQK